MKSFWPSSVSPEAASDVRLMQKDPVTVLITGGSHVVALNQGFKSLTESCEVPSTMRFQVKPLGGGLSIAGNFFRCRTDHVEITNPKFRARIERIPPAESSYDAVVLSTVLYSRPLWYKEDWAAYGLPGMSKGRIPVSNSLLRRVILDDSKYLISFLKHLRNLGIAVCVVEGPRPFRHNIEVQRVGPDTVRHLDARYRSLTMEVLAREDIPVIPLPDSVFDEEGFMLEEYRHDNPKDKTHGNAAFGRLMMLEVVRYVQGLGVK